MKHIVPGALCFVFVACMSAEASARERLRRRFDPDDLQLDDAGVVHADFSFGPIRGEGGGRWLAPDFDIDIGVSSNVELGVDGSWAVEGTSSKRFALDHGSPDNIWLSSKIELWVDKDEAHGTAWAFGTQFGPRAGVAPDAHGTGFQGLFLFGRRAKGRHIVVNGGALIDSGDAILTGRPIAVLSGLDGSIDLDDRGIWSIAGDLGGVFFITHQKDQLVTTIGPVLAVTPWLDVSVNALVGFLAGGDHWGGFLQISPKFFVF